MRLIEDKTTFIRNLQFLLTLGLATFPLLSIKATGILIVAWTAVTVLGSFFVPGSIRKDKIIPAVVLSSVFLLMLIHFPFSPTRAAGFGLEKSLSFLIFPLSWLLWPQQIKHKHLVIIYRLFILANFLVLLRVIGQMSLDGFDFITKDLSYSIRTEFERISGLHPTYMTILLLFALFVKGHQFWVRRKETSWATKAFDGLIGLTFFAGAVLLASRTPMAAFLGSTLVVAAIFAKNRKLVVGGMVMLVLASAFLFSRFPMVRSRFAELNPANMKPPKNWNYNSVNVRAGITICSVELLKEHWTLGLGAGNEQEALNSCYKQFHSRVYNQKDYNTHNQYFHYWLGMGIPGLLLFLLLLGWSMVTAFRNRDPVHLFLVLFFSICCLTENLLLRQAGIVFFIFFNTLLVFHGKRELTSSEPNT